MKKLQLKSSDQEPDSYAFSDQKLAQVQFGTITFTIDGELFRLGKAVPGQVDEIVRMINHYAESESELMPVSIAEVSAWVSKSLDFVVMDSNNNVIAHTAVDCWPKGAEIPMSRELRSVVVASEYREKLVYTRLTMAVVEALFAENSDIPLVEVKGGAQGHHLLEALGFEQYDCTRALELGMDFPGLAEGQWVVYGLKKLPDFDKRISEVKLRLSLRE